MFLSSPPPSFPLQVLVFSFWVDVLLILGHALEANQVPYAFGKVGTCAEGVNILQSSQQRSDGPTALPLRKHSGSSRFLLGSSSVPYTLSEWHVAHADMHRHNMLHLIPSHTSHTPHQGSGSRDFQTALARFKAPQPEAGGIETADWEPDAATHGGGSDRVGRPDDGGGGGSGRGELLAPPALSPRSGGDGGSVGASLAGAGPRRGRGRVRGGRGRGRGRSRGRGRGQSGGGASAVGSGGSQLPRVLMLLVKQGAAGAGGGAVSMPGIGV